MEMKMTENCLLCSVSIPQEQPCMWVCCTDCQKGQGICTKCTNSDTEKVDAAIQAFGEAHRACQEQHSMPQAAYDALVARIAELEKQLLNKQLELELPVNKVVPCSYCGRDSDLCEH